MNVGRLVEVYRRRLLTFLFKNNSFFQIHYNKLTTTRNTIAPVASIPPWKKGHSSMQTRNQGAKLFIQLKPEVRVEGRLSAFKRLIKTDCAVINWIVKILPVTSLVFLPAFVLLFLLFSHCWKFFVIVALSCWNSQIAVCLFLFLLMLLLICY